jgi:hypothetical protein
MVELTVAVCEDACKSQAWSMGTLLGTLSFRVSSYETDLMHDTSLIEL